MTTRTKLRGRVLPAYTRAEEKILQVFGHCAIFFIFVVLGSAGHFVSVMLCIA